MNHNILHIVFFWTAFFLLLPINLQAAKANNIATQPLEIRATKSKLKDQLVGGREYQIGPGDVLHLNVWKDEALSRQVIVLPDGTIALPLVGKLLAAGKTVTDIEKEITGKIKKYLPDPVLDVSVVQVNSMMIYVIGKVRNPGHFPLKSNVNVLQALAMAGGLDKHADEGGIKIHREQNKKTILFDFDYDDVVDGKKLRQNIKLMKGDVVVVP